MTRFMKLCSTSPPSDRVNVRQRTLIVFIPRAECGEQYREPVGARSPVLPCHGSRSFELVVGAHRSRKLR
ncbi:hypothetical protein SNOG_00576 [Parastagonospora nodorum SN15]|uniref:Uncharacterized protein n=1 Tax=Phaeosphaeria nodorum (strain SN15 / ATCC MYA-4574 / FGSC 10173) TaxID=321614 RepID=Q0V5Y8_PHANO|nr:hypothetical protein SNOG_00576 [Parastagonospora nodorum SN15]EAT92071.1 hypothetical protein SNOG_00576 [Parastagonospora nodorum SN15]